MAGRIFTNRLIRVANNSRPVMIVGECPGKQRKKDQTFEVFHGNRTGDFVEKMIEGFTNLILTNVCNFQKPHTYRETAYQIRQLKILILEHNPHKIICLGAIAQMVVRDLGFSITGFSHPSHVLRFNLQPEEYLKKIRNEIKESLQYDRP